MDEHNQVLPIDALPSLAISFADALHAQSGEQFDFSLASLARLDSVLDEWVHIAMVYGGAEPLDLQGYVGATLAYVGETLRRAFGGHWEQLPTRNWPVLTFPNGQQLDLEPLVTGVLRGALSPAFASLPRLLTANGIVREEQ